MKGGKHGRETHDDQPPAHLQGVAPVISVLALPLVWGRNLGPVPVTLVALVLAAAVMAAVHHAEVVAHRVGEPFGSLVLAVAVTVIEVALIVTLMVSGGKDTSTLARDTVFAAAMITCNGIVGLSLFLGARKYQLISFNAEGTGAALATVTTLAVMTMVLPTFTHGVQGPEFTGAQLAFAAVASLVLYGMFVSTQTRRHRDFFLPVTPEGTPVDDTEHASPPSSRAALTSLGLLLLSLVGVVGLAKLESPAIAIASIWLDGPLMLGLGSTQMVLLALTVVVSVLTVVPGRATRLQGGVHLILLAAFIFLAINP